MDRPVRCTMAWPRLASLTLALAVLCTLVPAVPAAAQGRTPVNGNGGHPTDNFPQNKQNEPALAVDPTNTNILVAGANDEIDLQPCPATAPADPSIPRCPFTDGVGTSGVYFSFNGGESWTQPTYTGWTARDCTAAACPSQNGAVGHVGPIGTLPRYYENGLVSDGDPALAFGPRRGANGRFAWANGARLYYANLTANFPASGRSDETFKGFEAVAVSRTDDVAGAAAGNNGAWLDPVIVSRQNAALFSDKEAVWADNAQSSPFFGNVYLCNVAFRSASANEFPEPVIVSRSTDGGDTWAQRQISQASNTGGSSGRSGGRQGCTVRTDSKGVVYVFWSGALKKQEVQYLSRSRDGGKSFEKPQPVATIVSCGQFDSVSDDVTFDGLAGARTNSFPSVDIANGAPSGTNAPDIIVLAWCDASQGVNNEQALVQVSPDGGKTWSTPTNGAAAGDRPDFPAVAISPNGRDLYLVYDAFRDAWQNTTATPRLFHGVVRHASGVLNNWSTLDTGATGDARGSSANGLFAEFLGDYNFAVATNTSGAAVWNDARDAADCPTVDAYRQSLATDSPLSKPNPGADCPPHFGNTDIYGGSYPDPNPGDTTLVTGAHAQAAESRAKADNHQAANTKKGKQHNHKGGKSGKKGRHTGGHAAHRVKHHR